MESQSSSVVLKKIKPRITICYSNSTSEHIPKSVKSGILKRHLYTHVHSGTIHNSQRVKAVQLSNDGSMDKMWFLYTVEYYIVLKRKDTFYNIMNLEDFTLSEINYTKG